MLAREPSECLRGIGKISRDVESHRIEWIVRCILYIIDLVTEALEAHNIMDVLPDDSRDGASPHEPEDDDLFPFHYCLATSA
jgi:hypothetical protein